MDPARSNRKDEDISLLAIVRAFVRKQENPPERNDRQAQLWKQMWADAGAPPGGQQKEQ